MELRYLRYFATVADRQNFTRASEELRVAQPAVSQQIKILEEELGVTLLLRTKRSVKLTAAGQAFLREAREILAHAEHAKQVARRAARGEIGALAIGCFSSAVAGFLPELIVAYRKKFPAVRVQMIELTPDQQLQAFAREKIDVGFTRPMPAAQARGFVQERVYRDRLWLALPAGHALAKAPVARLERFAGEEFLMFKRSEAPELVVQMVQLCARAGFTPKIVGEPPMMQTVLMGVAAGTGIALVPGCVRNFGQRGVVYRPVRPASPAIDLVVARQAGEVSPTVAAWMELLREQVPAIRSRMEAAD